jgi:uncharacterized NAD-dependent epimerase/dehydratase family protein
VRTVVVGVVNRGGLIADSWIEVLAAALHAGIDVVAGMHSRLADIEVLRDTARECGRQLLDVRHPTQRFAVANGKKRSGKRLLAVGTDCSSGKMYTALAIERELRRRGVAADFRATGQTGIVIAGGGVSVDAVVGDFMAGAIEWLTPAADPAHWDVIEGQGSLFHASYAGVSLALLHGSQPDALVLCHEPTRRHMRGLPDFALPPLDVCLQRNLEAARLVNADCRCVGIAINTSAMAAAAAERYLAELRERFGLPAVDPVRHGTAAIVDRLL